ncbi:phage tail protein, partial [Citrobacter braakii]|uniref:phage tail protein n=9 Tax=Enterobacteriaceae TaxID=543 RepID=UPI001F125986
MTAKYLAILTNQGAAKLANAAALGTKLNLTQLAVGDGNGVLPTPDPAQTKLVNQKRIAPLNQLSVDPNNASQIIAEQIIPENEGGFWIREIGLYDDDGDLIAVANCPETYKPQLQEGSGRTQTIRMILIVSSTSAVTLKIDPSVVLATRKYADDKVLELKLYTDEKLAKALALKQPLDQTLSDLSGKTAGGILEYLGLGEAAKRGVGTGVNQIPDMSSFVFSVSGGVNIYRFPNRMCIQWGNSNTDANGGAVVSLPVAMSAYVPVVIEGLSGSWTGSGGVYDFFTVYGAQVSTTSSFLAKSSSYRGSDGKFVAQSTNF